MFKNILIGLLAISTLTFAYIALRNSTPLDCSEVLTINGDNLCLINLHKLNQSELKQAIEQVKADSYKYNNN